MNDKEERTYSIGTLWKEVTQYVALILTVSAMCVLSCSMVVLIFTIIGGSMYLVTLLGILVVWTVLALDCVVNKER